MSLLKEISASAAAAWSPVGGSRSNMIAVGSKEGVGVGFDNYEGELQLYSMDFSDTSPGAIINGAVKTSARFTCLDWSYIGKHPSCGLGVIAGGMADGTVNFWDASKICGEDDAGQSQAGRAAVHKGQVKCLEFNPHRDSSHLLATGGTDNEVHIMALDVMDRPGIFSPGEATGPKHSSEVSCLAWNTKVSYILATGSQNGSTMIWDLKQKKPWCELKDPQKQGVSSIVWNPSEGLHIITASEDDQRPVLRMWDLRSSTNTPLVELRDHTAGILSMSWCPNDPGLLVSCGKDNRTLLWDLYTGKVVFELPSSQSTKPAVGSGQFFAGAAGGQRRFDVNWSPKIPAVISTCTFDGKVQVWGMAGAGTASTRAPKWYQRPCSASFGFGGKVVVVANPRQHAQAPQNKIVHIHRIHSEPKVIMDAESFEASIASRDFPAFCQQKRDSAISQHDKDIWSFMEILFEKDARQKLLRHLGFNADEVAKEAEVYADSEDTGEDGGLLNGPTPVYTMAGENMIKKALLVGNFEAAVECCLRKNQLADALLLATCGGPELWQKTQEAYFSRQTRPFMNIVKAVIKNQLLDLVEQADLDKWQETLALLSTYGKSEEFPTLCDALAARLEANNYMNAATLCYMCAVNVEKTVAIWVAETQAMSKTLGAMTAVRSLVEKVSIFRQALDPPEQDMGAAVAEQFSSYATMLADAGRLDIAARYAGYSHESCEVVRYRIWMAAPPPGQKPPPSPFQRSSQQGYQQAQSQQQQQQQLLQGGFQNQAGGYQQQGGYQNQAGGYQQQGAFQNQAGGYQQQGGFQNQAGGYQQQSGYQQLQQPTGGLQQSQSGYGQSTHGGFKQHQSGFKASYQQQQHGGFPTLSGAAGTAGGFAPGVQTPNSTGVNPLDAVKQATTRVSKPSVDMAQQRSDGFVSSVGNIELSKKYGNVSSTPESSVAVPNADAPAAPTPTVVRGAVDNVPAEHLPIVNGFNAIMGQLEATSLAPNEKRQVAEAGKGKDSLFTKLNAGDLSTTVLSTLHEIVGCFDKRDFRRAQQLHISLTTTDWAEHKDWLKGVKAMINIAIKRLSH